MGIRSVWGRGGARAWLLAAAHTHGAPFVGGSIDLAVALAFDLSALALPAGLGRVRSGPPSGALLRRGQTTHGRALPIQKSVRPGVLGCGFRRADPPCIPATNEPAPDSRRPTFLLLLFMGARPAVRPSVRFLSLARPSFGYRSTYAGCSYGYAEAYARKEQGLVRARARGHRPLAVPGHAGQHGHVTSSPYLATLPSLQCSGCAT
jgi:hypothetical protein